MTCGLVAASFTTHAGILDIAVATLGANNAAIMDQAEAQIPQSRAQAAYAIQRADQIYQNQLNRTNQYNSSQTYNNQPQATYNTDGTYTTQYLRSLDCAELAVSSRQMVRFLDNQGYTGQNTVSEKDALKAGLATAALSIFAGQNNSNAANLASAFTGQAQNSAEIDVAVANLENIQIYQDSKRCSVR